MDLEQVVYDVDRSGASERRTQDVEVAAHGQDQAFVGESQHFLDDPVMGHAKPENEATPAHGLDRQGLLGQGDGVPGLDGHDRRPDFDP